MNLERAVLTVAGTVILLSVLLTVAVSTWWLPLLAFVGLTGCVPIAARPVVGTMPAWRIQVI
jgi:hypothetical protein